MEFDPSGQNEIYLVRIWFGWLPGLANEHSNASQ